MDSLIFVDFFCCFDTGDQGFLNAYYSGFPSARVFDPNISTEELNSKPVAEMERLSTIYNADVGLYMLANKVGCVSLLLFGKFIIFFYDMCIITVDGG